MRKGILITVMMLVLVAWASAALAHGVRIFAYGEEGRIKGEAYFAGGAKVRKRPVQLMDSKGNKLEETTTDEKGAFSFPLPKAAPPFRLVVLAGQGHRAEFWVNAIDLGLDTVAKQAKPRAAPAQKAAKTTAVDTAALQKALDQVLAKRLAPLRGQLLRLAEDQQKVGLREVVGGLGWILGLVGIAAWFKARQMKQEAKRG